MLGNEDPPALMVYTTRTLSIESVLTREVNIGHYKERSDMLAV